MSNTEENRSTMRIYGTGGAGINLASYFNKTSIEPNCAVVKPAYIDTSRSNLRPEFKEEDIFILKNVDGSGKLRKENHEEIANVIKQILLQIEPGDFNVVIFSASGGSGSVMGPLIAGELLERGETVVCVVVGSDESSITATNTLNTLKSLEAISKRSGKPLVMYYEHNERNRRRSEIDSQVRLAISTLAILSSGRNREMDSMDIKNWVFFNNTTTVAPQLAMLEIFGNIKDASVVKDPIAIASVYKDEEMEHLHLNPEYSAVGYMRDDADTYDQFHYVISIDAVPTLVGSIKETLKQYNTQTSSRVKQASILGDTDNVTDTGLVL